MTLRAEPVTNFGPSPPPGPLKVVLDILHAVFGKVVSFGVVVLISETAGHAITNVGTTPGTTVTSSRTLIDFQDAGVDSVRLVVRAKNSVTNDLTIEAFNATTSVAIATAVLDTSQSTEQTVAGAWIVLAPNGGDEDIYVRAYSGTAADDPTLYAVHLQLRTTQARA